MAAVICVDVQADLTVDLYALMSSVYLEDKPIYFLQVSTCTYFDILVGNLIIKQCNCATHIMIIFLHLMPKCRILPYLKSL